jgi:Phytanoyl-CoA dioxygenase (PhyH)
MLDPRILHVIAALIEPDVLAADDVVREAGGKRWAAPSPGLLQHQHRPDTLIGAWDALDRADTENGYLWTSPGRQHEPVYRDVEEERAMARTGCSQTSRPSPARTPRMSHATDSRRSPPNTTGASFRPVLDPDDVRLLQRHVLHRSQANRSSKRSRRFVRRAPLPRPLLCLWDDKPLARGENGQRPPYTRARLEPATRPAPSWSLTTTWSYRARRGSPDPRVTDPTGVRKPSLAYARERIPARPRAPA